MFVVDLIISIFLMLGALIMLLGSIGLLRFGDVFLRMHAASKASTLGISFLMVGVAIHFSEPLLTIKLIALAAIYFFSAPTGSQVLARGAHVAKTPMVKETWIDELAETHYTDVEAEVEKVEDELAHE